MAKNISLICGLLAILAVATLLLDYKITPEVRSTPDTTQETTAPLHTAPDFSFTDTNGVKSALSAYRGKIVILHFWATWCPPCLVEFPKLVEAANARKETIVVLAVSSDDDRAALKKFTSRLRLSKANNPNIHIIWDEGRTITHDQFQTFSYPETIIIDVDGKMTRKIAGDMDWTGPEMTAYLDKLTAGLAEKTGKP